MIKVDNISGGYGGTFRLENIHFEVNKGEFFGIIGPNGSGKTTLVKMLSGLIRLESGNIFLNHRQIEQYRPKQLAKKLAVLPQLTEQSFRFTVRETVALGRYAHQTSLFATLTKHDDAIIDEVLEHTDVKQYEHVTIDQLSGGERQRVFLAQALAQEPEIIILDEPTNHLDLAYQKELLDLLNLWTVERKLTVVAIFHDLNLASLYCDRLLLLNKGKIHVCGEPNEVLQHEHISDVYQTEIENRSHPEIPKLQVMLTPKQINRYDDTLLKEEYLMFKDGYIAYHSPIPLKTLSTSHFNGGNGWYKNFINRYIVNNNRSKQENHEETVLLLKNEGFDVTDSIVTLTSTNLEQYAVKKIDSNMFSLIVVVTASALHAVDVSLATKHLTLEESGVGTINSWIFIDGKLSDFAFVQAIVTATEAKTKALNYLGIKDNITDTSATGTSTDNIVLATTQRGGLIETAKSTSPLGAQIGEIVFQCTIDALKNC